jgi:cysteine desulfurase
MEQRIVYLDNAATTKPDRSVVEAMMPYMGERYGNPSSLHRLGLESRRALDEARSRCANHLETRPRRVIFTAGGTESNNLIVKGIASFMKDRCVILTRLEHASVSEPAAMLERQGIQVLRVNNDGAGTVDLTHLKELLTAHRCGLLCVIHGSNEVGTLQDVRTIGALLQKMSPKTWFHLDAVQSIGHIPLAPEAWGVHSMALSSHKIHGPRGAGLLALYRDARLEPLSAGGGQEGGHRSGTENLPAIIGTAKAMDLALADQGAASERMAALRDRLARHMEKEIPDVRINGAIRDGLPHILSVSFAEIIGEVLLHHLEERGIMVSTGSACHARWKEVSATLKALNLPPRYVRGTIRFSLSRHTTEEEIDYTAAVLKKQVAFLREVGIH